MRKFKSTISVLAITLLWVGCAKKVEDMSAIDGFSIPADGQIYQLGAGSLKMTPDQPSDDNPAVDNEVADADSEMPQLLELKDGNGDPLSKLSDYSTLKMVPVDGGYEMRLSVPDQKGCVVTLVLSLLSTGESGKLEVGSPHHESTCSLLVENELNKIASEFLGYFKQTVYVAITQAEDGSLKFSLSDLRLSEYLNREIKESDDGVFNSVSITLVPAESSIPTALVPDFSQLTFPE